MYDQHQICCQFKFTLFTATTLLFTDKLSIYTFIALRALN